jgi:antitoxin HigA-1
MGPMKDPPHPGEIIREEVVKPLGLSVTDAARALGVTRQALSLLLNGRTDLSPEMALRIEAAFGPKAEVLIGVRLDHSMARAQARQREITANGQRAPQALEPRRPARPRTGTASRRSRDRGGQKMFLNKRFLTG